ncbi:DUF309 domain-containing protein [Sulfurospirillum barnesii]|uniref:DUF309 domain-containing protein n=1 Tax=Sulfurospirillum barnesii (strain ATCC 700032 / DSM 10660 / SES-3) TaxID=760154 RepID=I3XUH4_SULBS|nr:DUF309 domain-containing protein [Sulfurospirillum barnesii]AFL67598.1 protein of unknown function (DUF309) [Sulfurospirillum barnesii SES-3]
METLKNTLFEAIELFLRVVENNQFVEGHEVLEDEWKRLKTLPEHENEAKILKGLINASTALALASKGKKEGAMRVWQTYEKYAPLIMSTQTEHTPSYKEAQRLLQRKYTLYM